MSDRNENASSPQEGGSMSIQEKVEDFFNTIFGKWGILLATHTCKIFWLSILFFVILSGGMAMRQGYEDENLIWTPADNGSLKSSDKSKIIFPSKGGFISIIAEVKEPTKDGSSIITVNALNEIKDYVDQMHQTYAEINGTKVYWKDICNKIGGSDTCFGLESMLSFGYDSTPQQNGPPKQTWNKNAYASDSDFLSAVQSGKKGNNIIELQAILGGTAPEKINQDSSTGSNDLKSAKATMFGYPYTFSDKYSKEEIQKVEAALEDRAETFNEKSKAVNIYLFTQNGLRESFSGDMTNDLSLVQISVMLVAVYCILFMGGCSPIHFRSAAAGITLLCVGLSFGSSNGLAYLVGGKSAGIHNLLPFLLIGIGVDDMFVISSNIDQTNPRWPIEKRMQIGLQHAGSSITITSFTNAIAFFLGCTSSLEALSSFCFFAGLGVLMLYLTSISVFAAFMVWDIKRQQNQKGDCCGACCCKEDSIICCKGFFLTTTQKSYPFQGSETDEQPDEKYANGTQKFLHQKFSAWTTSKPGIVAVLVVWLIYTAVSVWGASEVKVDFKQTYFISASSYVRNFMDRQEEHFKSGERITVYTESNDIDMTSYEMQANMNKFIDKLKKCDGCSQKWTVSDSFDSWYLQFKDYSKTACTGSWDSQKNAIVPQKYMECLKKFLKTAGVKYNGDINMNDDKTKITSSKQSIKLIYIEDSAGDGVDVLKDMQNLCNGANVGDTYSFNQRYFIFETYVVFKQEAIMNVCLALAAVFVVLMIVTANLTVTMFILLCVILVDLFLMGLLHFWNVTFNSVTVVNNVIAIGLAVDYSAHIGHSYLMAEAPEQDESGNALSNHEKRVFKARQALGSMGSSVFHGAFSTLLAIIVLSPSKSYIFMSFFKMWFGIIIFGVANGFILLPVLLSLCGPLNAARKRGHQVEDQNDMEMKKVEDPNNMMEGGRISISKNSIENSISHNQVANTNRVLNQ